MRINCVQEIENGIWAVQTGRTQNILRPICKVCRRRLSKWDIRNRQAVCWRCQRDFPSHA